MIYLSFLFFFITGNDRLDYFYRQRQGSFHDTQQSFTNCGRRKNYYSRLGEITGYF